MKRLLFFISIVGLMATGMAQQPQQGREMHRQNPQAKNHTTTELHDSKGMQQNPFNKMSDRHSSTSTRKYATALNNPKIQKAIAMQWDSVVETSNDYLYFRKISMTYENNVIAKMEDSFVYENYNNDTVGDRYIYSFENGKISDYIYYQWDNIGQEWIEDAKYKVSFATLGDTISEMVEEWEYIENKWIPYLKYEYIYDNKGNEVMFSSYYWESANSTWRGDKSEFNYDIYDNQISEIKYSWNVYTNAWQQFFKSEFSFDNNGNQTMNSYYNWDNYNSFWKGTMKDSMVYNQNEMQTMQLFYNWDDINSTWREENKNEMQYDQYDNYILYIQFDWNIANNDWDTTDITTYTNQYDANTKLIEVVEVFNNNNSLKMTYEYTGTQETITYYSWDTTGGGAWVESLQEVYDYDNKGNQTMWAHYQWDGANGMWVGNYKMESWYAGNGEVIKFIYYNKWEPGDTWTASHQNVKTLDESYSIHDLVIPELNIVHSSIFIYSYPNTAYKIDKDESFGWNTASNSFVLSSSYTYYYSEKNTAIIDVLPETGEIKVYPNPVQHTLYIESPETVEQVSIYDISGRVLLQIIYPEQSVDISHLVNGLYLVKVITETTEKVKKIVKN